MVDFLPKIGSIKEKIVMQQKTSPGFILISEELDASMNHLQSWLNIQVAGAKKVSEKILQLFEDDKAKEKKLLTIPATLIGESSGWVYSQISDKFPKDLTLLDCIILTGINNVQNPSIEIPPRFEQVIVKMSDVKNITAPKIDFSKECATIEKVTEGVISIRPFSASSKTEVFVFIAKFDFEKTIPALVFS